ncbi:MAG: HXXEE domain-containing protein [Treponema sp.]|nr:HXXEE domain-containing protein [Treponema sp.]
MKEYVWLFPVIFMFHEMEEIIGFKFFLQKNKDELENRFPRIAKNYKDFSTEGFAFATYEEFILSIAISALAYFIDTNILWYIWLGVFIGCDIHFFIHLIQMSIFKRYIPACITSLICLPINTLIICKCILYIQKPYLPAIAFILLGGLMVLINLKLAIKLIGWFTRKTNS